MIKYIENVISVIDKKGEEVNVKTNEFYHKHVQPFKKLPKAFKIDEYLKEKGTDNITGYDLASFIAANGNIVFFHTDVSNYKIDKRQGSVIIPSDITEKQILKLKEMIESLEKEEFTFYVSKSQFKKKNSYKLVHQPLNLAILKKLVYNVDIIEGEMKK